MKTTYFWKAEHEPIYGTKYVSIASGNMQHCNFPVYKDLCIMEYYKNGAYLWKYK